jgi:hypothetical protein
MREISYVDFDLSIEHVGDHYRAHVLDSPVGQASGDFSLPFSETDIELFVLRLARTRGMVRRIDSPGMDAAKDFGGRLFDSVFTGDVRGCLKSSLDQVDQVDSGLRLRLRLTDAPELADLPWEFLYNRSRNQFLSLSDRTPIVRYVDLSERVRPLTVQAPLRVLVMISSPSDVVELDVDREWRKLDEAVGDLKARGRIALERLDVATLGDLQRRLRKGDYHIFHFIGHGGFDPGSDDGKLLLEDEVGRSKTVSGESIGTILHDHRPLRLAVLNACEGARASRADPFAGVAQSLVLQGIPSVIAMQFEISDEAAVTLTAEFYGAIADGYPVDAALTEARKAVLSQGSDVEWATPVLYMRSPDGRVFEVETLPVQEPPKQEPPKQEPPRQEPPKQEPPKQEPPKQEPPKQEPPRRNVLSRSIRALSEPDPDMSNTLTIVFLALAAVVVISTFDRWGWSPRVVNNGWDRTYELVVWQVPPHYLPWFLRLGVLFVALAIGVGVSAVLHRRRLVALFGALAVICSATFSMNYYLRSAKAAGQWNQQIEDAGLSSVTRGTWLAIVAGLIIVVLALVAHKRPGAEHVRPPSG